MTTRLPVTAAPEHLEAHTARFDDLFVQRSQREGFRRYWRSWSPPPPPPALRCLLEYLRHGHGLDLYASP